MEQIEKEEERLDKILFKIKLLIEHSDSIRENINRFSSIAFGFPVLGTKETEKILPECVVNDIISNLNILENYLGSIGTIVNKLNAELENKPITQSF